MEIFKGERELFKERINNGCSKVQICWIYWEERD